MLVLTLVSVPRGLSFVLAPGFEPAEGPGPHLYPFSFSISVTDPVAAVLDFHQEYDITAFDDLQRENFPGV